MSWTRCLILLCSIAAMSQATTNLRGNNATTVEEEQEDEPPRLINAELINAFLDTYGWELVDYLQQQLAANYDPVYVGTETTVNASGFDLPAYLPNCIREATIDVGVGYLTGLSNLEVNNFGMIPGTEDIEFLGFMGNEGVIWNGTLAVNATFSQLTMDTSVSMVANSCNIDERSSGITVLSNVNVLANITVGGRTRRWQEAFCTTQVTHAHVESVDMSFGNVDLGLEGASPIMSMALNFLESDPATMEGMVEEMEPLLVSQVNQELEAQMPYDLCKEPAVIEPALEPPVVINVTQPPTPPPTTEKEDEEIDDIESLRPSEVPTTTAPTESEHPTLTGMTWWHPTLAVLLGLAVAVLAFALWLRFFNNRERNSAAIKMEPEVSYDGIIITA